MFQSALTIADTEGPEMPQNRHTVKAYFIVKQEAAQQLRGDSSLKILLYCGLAKDMTHSSSAEVAFPGQVELKVNEQEVRSNFKGLKNKPGSTKPADITAFVRKYRGEQNIVQLTYALTTKRYAYTIYLVRHNSTDQLVERIKKQSIIRKQTVLNNMSKAKADDEVAATSFGMSLKDPVSTLRINMPIRSSNCAHYQCFDGAMFMQLQEQAPQWSCPVCSKAIPFESLCVDEYFQEILAATPKSTEKVDVQPDGKWKVIKDENDSDADGPSNKPRASYDDDFDDDLVEVDQPGGRITKGIKRESQSQVGMSAGGHPFALDTPPLSSREPSVAQSASSAQRNKRPQSAVVDLTLSDDEDEQPPRPAKRPNTNQQSRNSTQSNAYNTPNSLPEPRLNLPQRPPPTTNSNNHQHYHHHHQQPDLHRSNSATSFNQGPPSGFNSISPPPNANSPAVFGQPSFPIQHSRPPTQLPNPQPYSTNNTTSFSNHASTFAPNSPFTIPPPSQQNFHQPNQDHNSASTNISGGGLRLPPMQHNQTYQQQQRDPWSSSPAPSFSGGWRSDGNDYGYHFNAGSPG
jgi:E3 SUMO-protein ligase PIAS1